MKTKSLSKEDQKIIDRIYHKGHGRYLKLTMLDIKRLFADKPEIDHFDDIRVADLMGELESRILKYVKAGGEIKHSSESSYSLVTLALLRS